MPVSRFSHPHSRCPHRILIAVISCAALACALLSPGSKLYAQVAYGINGTVTDTTGASIPGVQVVVVNKATGVASRATTSAAGAFRIVLAVPGNYSVTATAKGFKKSIKNNVTVVAGQFATVTTRLVPGAVSETVHVSGNETALNTVDPTIGTTLGPELMAASPVEVNGGPRSIDNFVLQGPGSGQPNNVKAEGHNGAFFIDGGITEESSNYYNGIPVADTNLSTGNPIFPPYELVNQFHISSSTFSSQYGLGQGIITYKTASGTNALHGDAFDILRNSFFDSPGFFPSTFNRDGKPIPPPNHQNNYGFTVGGPVMIPKVYNGKNRTFFLFALDMYRQNQAQTAFGTVPTAAEKNGDFSSFRGSNGKVIPIFDPLTGEQFPGNIIPRSRFSPISASVLPDIPDPNRAGVVFGEQQNELPAVTSVEMYNHKFGFTLDENLTEARSLHFAYWFGSSGGNSLGANIVQPTNPISSVNSNTSTGSGYLLNYVDVVSPHLVVTAGVAKIDLDFDTQALNDHVSFPGIADANTFPGIQFEGSQGLSGWGNVKTLDSSRRVDISAVNNWLWTVGRNSLNIGGELRRSYEDTQDCSTCGSRTQFSHVETSTPNTGPGFGTNGSAFAGFLLGDVDNTLREFSQYVKLRNLDVSPYIQDDIQVNSRLTLNFGLRWDVMVPVNAVDNNLVFADFSKPNLAAGGLAGAVSKFGSCAQCTGTHRANIHWGNIGPRVGFSYMANSKTVIQGGFYRMTLTGGSYSFAASRVAQQYVSLLAGSFGVGSTGTNAPGFGSWDARPIPAPPAVSFTPALGNAQLVRQMDPRTSGIAPYSMQWTFGVQRQLPWSMLMMVAYVGNRDIHLPSSLNQPNQLPLADLSYGPLLGDLVTSPQAIAAGIQSPYPGFVQQFGSAATVEQALLPFPQFAGTDNHFDQAGTSEYNAIQINLEKRFTNNVSFLTNLTVGRDQSDVDYGVTLQQNNPINTFDQKLEWAASTLNQKYAYKFVGTYALPFGPGQEFLGSNNLTSKLLGGWQVAGILDYFAGNPIGNSQNNVVLMATNTNGDGENRPNIVPNVKRKTFSYNTTKRFFEGKLASQPVQFTTNAFTPSPQYGLGDAARNYSSITSPPLAMESFDATKSFPITEKVHALIRVSYFNAFNRTQLQIPDNTIDDSTFGMVTKQSSQISNRQGQLTLRITF